VAAGTATPPACTYSPQASAVVAQMTVAASTYEHILGGEGGAEVDGPRTVGAEDTSPEGVVVMAIGRLPAQPVDGGGIPAGLPLALHPPPRPDTLAEQAGGVHLRPLAVEHRPEHPHRVPLPLARGHTSRSLYLVHRASPWPEPRGHF
jgi:hypothetical protein